MKRALFAALLLAGCATTPAPPGTQVPAERLQTVVPGTTTKAQLLAAFGPTKSVVFDSGYEAWLYQAASGAGRFFEFVVLIDPAGMVAKTRTGPAAQPSR
ncbi:hypothetical protein [Massilia sp. LC238]|uniref:hypothetical protein n=1 Tax=Massilia sp. LC238 TaxID=1502852 RepID=UPI0004E2E91D|nr:hypothetical protein [Massilia sp. LC238]KFC73457.1 hypothetical protein FG94_01235 [Massilia sp. LC238]